MSDHEAESADTEAPPAALVAKRIRTVPRLQYVHSYSYVFEGHAGFTNLILLSICMLIPIIGPIVMAGYQYEVISALHKYPKATYPAFDFGRFGEYLGRGIWKFLADMISQVVLVPVYIFVYFFTIIGLVLTAAAFAGPQNNNAGTAFGIAAMIIIPIDIIIIVVVTIGMRLLLNPLILKASLSGEGADLFDFGFMVDFVKRTWRETIWEVLWVYVTFPIIVLLGLLLCIVGVLPAVAWSLLADAHTNWQLYEIYLARGGRPVRLKAEGPSPVIMADVLEE